jgi:acyl-coenzyme A synthetase/AMP-(fatty) acid ligase
MEHDNGQPLYQPVSQIAENANITAYLRKKGLNTWDELYQWTCEHAEEFWSEMAGRLGWYAPWEKILDDSHKPFYRWFTGAKCNIVHNAIERHLKTWRRNKQALICEGEDGSQRNFSYLAVNREVWRLANVLKSMGVEKGDIVSIYMPRVPELMFTMLGCAKIGAAHSVIYGGFSVEALRERIADAESKVLVTADGGFMRGKIVELKKIADEAMQHSPSIQTCIVLLVIKQPWLSLMRTILNDAERYKGRHWHKDRATMYIAGDSARCDEDGYFWVIGRIDDVIKVSGYRLGTDEIESALVSRRAIAEAAAIGLPHELKGSAIHCFVILRQGFEGTVVLEDELKAHVAAELGPIARPAKINFVASLPKTRSGKIMRRVLKAQALGQDVGDISTLEA